MSGLQTATTLYHRAGYRNPIPTTDILIEYSDGKKEGIVLDKSDRIENFVDLLSMV